MTKPPFDPIRQVSRTEAKQVECPVCRAQPGQKCFSPRTGRVRESIHLERMKLRARAREDGL